MQASLVIMSAVALTVVMLGFWVPVSWRSSDGGIDRVAKRVYDAGIFVQSTLVAYDTFSTRGRTALIDDPVVEFLLPSIREAWREEPKRGIPLNRLTGFNQKVAGALHRNGVPIMAGTDAMGLPLVAPGSSLHKELQLLSESGLSPYEVIRSATVVPAAFLGKTKEFGTIAVGQRADLLLVAGNPLENLAVLRRPSGVMVRGRWLPRQKLDELLKTARQQRMIIRQATRWAFGLNPSGIDAAVGNTSSNGTERFGRRYGDQFGIGYPSDQALKPERCGNKLPKSAPE